MKIQGSQPHGPVERVGTPSTSITPKHDAVAADRASEQVNVSSAGRKLAAARSPEVPDEKRIAELRAQIEAGTLAVDPQRIADAMLSEER